MNRPRDKERESYDEYRENLKVYILDIDFNLVEFSNVGYKYLTDLSGYTMEDFHCGMPDLIYDRDVPEDFGKEGE